MNKEEQKQKYFGEIYALIRSVCKIVGVTQKKISKETGTHQNNFYKAKKKGVPMRHAISVSHSLKNIITVKVLCPQMFDKNFSYDDDLIAEAIESVNARLKASKYGK